jgi:phosphoribosylanthranilate isomerase
VWIKICGITSLQDAEVAIAAGADALGFIFAESPRRVTPEAVREIVNQLPQSVEKIGVFVDASLDRITEVHHIAGLTGVQLHGASHAVSPQALRGSMRVTSRPARVLQVVRYDGDSSRFALELRKLQGSSKLDGRQNAVLVDTCIAGKQGGTGVTFDWLAARDNFLQQAPHLRLIAAGGLRPENVRHAIQMLRPWGVDVSSGVEMSPGRKDPKRVTDFIHAARAAEMDLDKSDEDMKARYSNGNG